MPYIRKMLPHDYTRKQVFKQMIRYEDSPISCLVCEYLNLPVYFSEMSLYNSETTLQQV